MPVAKALSGPQRRIREEALRQRIEEARTASHGKHGPADGAFLLIQVHLRDPTSVAHLFHVFTNYPPPRTAQCGTSITSMRRISMRSFLHPLSRPGPERGRCPDPAPAMH